MNEEQEKVEKEIVDTEQNQTKQIPIFDSEDFLKVLEHIEKELKGEKIFRTSIWWYVNLFIQLIFYFGIGLGLLVLFEPFKVSNTNIIYIYLGISTLIFGGAKIYTHLSHKPMIKIIETYVSFGISLILSVVTARYLPGILNIDYVLLIIYIFIMLMFSESIQKFFKKYIRGSYEKIK